MNKIVVLDQKLSFAVINRAIILGEGTKNADSVASALLMSTNSKQTIAWLIKGQTSSMVINLT
jgi:hypothetical protein